MMKKITLLLFAIVAFTGFAFTQVQVIEDFESVKMNLFDGGANGEMSVVSNPDPTGADTSLYVGKMVRGMDGQPWAGWYGPLSIPVDVSANRYAHVKVWKTRLSPVVFKYENGAGANSGDIYSMDPQTVTGAWEELVFDMSVVSGEYKQIVLIPDFESPLTLTEDITIYFDDIYANDDPTVGSEPVQILENFEHIPLNLIVDDKINDLSSMTLVTNPDKSGVNLSSYVCEFLRDKDGLVWDGFWSSLPTAVDATDNKYVHVKVWKPRVSVLKFKLEGGAAGTLEIPSLYPQTKTNEWEDIVFDFSAKTGTYPIIAFLPDFNDPVGLTSDMVMYFDDIRINSDPNPLTPPSQIINVDMSPASVAGQQVFISGAIGGDYGSWAEPGTIPGNEMFDLDGDGIYTIVMSLPDGPITFKFFLGAGWGTGDPATGGDRSYDVSGNANLKFVWGVQGYEDLTAVKNTFTGKVQMYPNPVNDNLYISTSNANVKSVVISNMLGQVVARYDMTAKENKVINTSKLSRGMYLVTFGANDGSKLTQKLMKE